MKHEWKKREYTNEIDNFAVSAEYHNGPECIHCGFTFCEHCTDMYDDDTCPGPVKEETDG